MKHLFNICSVILLCSLNSCFKEELPVPRRDRGPSKTGTVEMGNLYDEQIYYSLSLNSVVKTVNKYQWHLALSGDINNPYAMLNTAVSMYICSTNLTTIPSQIDTMGFWNSKNYDYPAGVSDSLAMRNAVLKKEIMAVNLGHDEFYQNLGFLITQIEISDGQYKIHTCQIDGNNARTIVVNFDDSVQHILLNLQTGNIIKEPSYNRWDILFTQYQHIYYQPFQTYSVVGCMLNTKKFAGAAYKGSKKYKELNQSDTSLVFSNRRNIIGFDWKYFDLNSNQYIIRPDKSYILRDKDNRYYKLHFIGFYNQTGVKGSPTFEYQEL